MPFVISLIQRSGVGKSASPGDLYEIPAASLAAEVESKHGLPLPDVLDRALCNYVRNARAGLAQHQAKPATTVEPPAIVIKAFDTGTAGGRPKMYLRD